MTKKQRKKKKKLQMINKKLVKKYPWLLPRNAWTGKVPKDYDYTYIEWGWSKGWDKAFGMMYLKELGDAIEKSGIKNFQILQIKEKYGSAVLYCNSASEEIYDVIRKYEYISSNICMGCGLESPLLDDGWISPWCLKCWSKIYRERENCYLEGHPEKSPTSDEEIKNKYIDCICDDVNDDGTWMPDTYTVHRYSDGSESEIVYDISDTVDKIRKRQQKWISYKKTKLAD